MEMLQGEGIQESEVASKGVEDCAGIEGFEGENGRTRVSKLKRR